jgi:hypothetical protein
MSSRILADDFEPGRADTHPSAPPPAEPQPAAPPAEPREPPSIDGGEPAEPTQPPAEEPISAAAQARIDRLTRERYEAQRERDQVRADWQRWQQQQQQQVPPTPEERARQQGYQQRQQEELGRTFDQACNDLYVRGREEYGAEMDDAVQALRAVGWGDRHDALAALTQLEGGHRVYRELARDLDRAARVLNLPPMAMAMELTRMAGGPAPAAPAPQSVPDSDTGGRPPVEVSRAPEPVRHIGGRSTQQERPLDHPQVTMAEFIRRRDRDQRRSRIAR